MQETPPAVPTRRGGLRWLLSLVPRELSVGSYVAIATTLVLIVSAVYGAEAMRRAYQGPPLVTVRDVGWRERVVVAPLLALIIVVGLAPRLVTDRIGDNALPAVQVTP